MLHISAEIFDVTDEAVLLFSSGKCSYANPAACRMFPQGCIGSTPAELLGNEYANTVSSSNISNIIINDCEYTVRLRNPDGTLAVILSKISPVPELVNDSFIYTLRNNLMNLHLTLCSLRENELSAKSRQAVADISRSCYKLTRLINNLSLVRGLEDGNFEFSPRSFDASAHVFELLDSLELLFPNFTFCGKFSGELMIEADPAIFDGMILNLISNAILHARECSRITVSLSPMGKKILLSVSDNGIGMSEKELFGVFDSFSRPHELCDIGKGAGFGLSAVRAAARIHGGTVMLESSEGRGTSVRVSLSRKLDSGEALNADSEPFGGGIDPVLCGMCECLDSSYFTEKYTD